jgi:hypothetical protein
MGESAWRHEHGVAFYSRHECEVVGGPRRAVRRILPRGAGGKLERRIGERGGERRHVGHDTFDYDSSRRQVSRSGFLGGGA